MNARQGGPKLPDYKGETGTDEIVMNYDNQDDNAICQNGTIVHDTIYYSRSSLGQPTPR